MFAPCFGFYPIAWRPTPPPRCSQVCFDDLLSLYFGLLGIAGSVCYKMIPRDFELPEQWTSPGSFDDSFSLNFRLPGSAGSTVAGVKSAEMIKKMNPARLV